MEKKRKRASFSATMPEPSSTPQPRQVVEVIVEESTTNLEKAAPQINIVIPPTPERVTTLEPEKKTEPKQYEFVENVRIKEPEPVENPESEEETEIDDEEPFEVVADYSPKEPGKEEVIPTYEPNHETKYEPKPEISEPETDRKEEQKQEVAREEKRAEEEFARDDKNQKETVEELFGKNSQSVLPEITVHKNTSNRGLLIWAITMVAVAVGVGGGLVLFTNRGNKADTTPTIVSGSPTSAVAPTSSPIPSPSPTIKPIVRSTVKIQVLNGGGKVGAGSKMKTLLEDKGYKVLDTGNASSYTYDQTEISVKQSVSDIRDTLEQDLTAGGYTVGKIETNLPESSAYDARVIVGKQ